MVKTRYSDTACSPGGPGGGRGSIVLNDTALVRRDVLLTLVLSVNMNVKLRFIRN